MDPYQIICLLKGISVVRMEACATNIKVEVTIHEPYADPLSVGRPRLTHRQLAAFALDFPHAIREVLRDVVSERDEARRHLCDLYVKGQPSSSNMTDQDYAAELGWDCFKEDCK